MNVNESEFFKEATLRICGSLEIEKALWLCFLYIRQYIPADQGYLTYYNREQGAIHVLATANSKEGLLSDINIPLPTEARALIESIRFLRFIRLKTRRIIL